MNVIKYKQELSEVEQNVRDLFASYEAKGRTLENSTYNGELILKYLSGKFMENGVIDASFTNFRKAVAALHASNLLHWTKEPAKKIEKPQQRDFDHAAEVAARDAKKLIDEAKRADDEASINNAIYIAAFEYVAKLWPNLAMNEHNYKLLCGFIRVHAGDDFSPNNMMVAVKELWPKLQKEQPAAPPAATAEPAEVLGTLKNGEPQLPLDASELKLRSASLEQVRDVYRRRIAASGSTIKPSPSHSRSQDDF